MAGADAQLWKRLRHLWLAAAPVCTIGCGAALTGSSDYARLSPLVPPALTRTASSPDADGAIRLVSHVDAPPIQADQPIPVSLDTVLRLAEEHNPRIRIAREKLHESEIDEAQSNSWLPKVTAGVGYFRHEGGIQDFNGNLVRSSYGSLFPGLDIQTEIDLREATYRRVDAERKTWQQRGEARREASENLVESANAYLDLLLAQRAEAVDLDLEQLELDVLSVTESIYKADKQAEILVETTKAGISARRQQLAQVKQQAEGAAAKLAYLLGLGPNAHPVPVEKALAPIDLVDATPSSEELVARALANGPGIRELESLLAAVQRGIDQSQGPIRFMPTIGVGVVEGAFGAGPGASLEWDNRLDIGVTAKWNLTDLLNSNARRAKSESQRLQVEMNLEDLRGGLAAKVREAREAIVQGREQIRHLTEQVQHANNVYRLSKRRFDADRKQYFSEVLQSIRLLEAAHLQYLKAISDYNKAEFRLLVLLGAAGHEETGHRSAPSGCATH